METARTIFGRYSCREYLDKPISWGQIKVMLQAAMAAPTACNVQPWEFIIVDDSTQISRLGENSPLVIVICGVLTEEVWRKRFLSETWIQDCSAAAENLLLMAYDLGLGACWHIVHPVPEIIAKVKAVCEIPLNATPLCMITIGYPAENLAPKEKFKTSRIHKGTWNNYHV